MSILHSSSVKLFSVVAILSLLIVSSAASMAENQTAPLPTWTKGQTWAVGGEKNLSNVLGENQNMLDNLAVLGNITIENLQLTGSAGAWTVFKVADVTQDTYLLEYSIGLRIHGDFNVQLSGSLPRAGNYNVSEMTKVYKVISGDASLNFLVTSHGIATIDKATMGIISVTATSVLDERLTFNATNFPNYTTSGILPMKVNMTFEDYAIDESLHLKLNSTVDFTPELSLFEFPLAVGDNWTVDSKATFEGDAEGYFNATGLPSSTTSSMVNKNGAFNGSVRIQDLTKLGTMQLNNGTIKPVEQDIQTSMQCVGTKSIDDASGNNITIFDVKEKQSGAHLYYSPNTGFLATALIQPQLSMLNGFVTLPSGSITNSVNLNTEISMTPADPANATNEISQIGSYQGVEPVSLISSGTGSTGLGQDSMMIIIFIAVIVVIAAIVGGVLLLRKKVKKGP
jgi:hypothetical protein